MALRTPPVGLDPAWPLVPELALELHGDLIASWSSATKNTDKKRYRAYRFFRQPAGENQ